MGPVWSLWPREVLCTAFQAADPSFGSGPHRDAAPRTFATVPLGPQEETAKTALGAVLLVANVVIARTSGDYFGTPAESNALLHTWSLSLEEQFYLVFPFLLLVALKWMERNRFLPQIVVGAVLAGSLTLAVSGDGLIDWPVPESFVGFYGPATRAWEFAIGSLIALYGSAS